MKKIAIFPGSFDPFTKGHEDIVLRGLAIFDEIIVGVGNNPNKSRYFPLDKMIACIEATFAAYPNVKVVQYQELTAIFAEKLGANYILRGLRNTTDYEYENSIGQANKHINPHLETVFLITSPALAYISSTFIRELHKFGQKVDDFIPYNLSDFSL